MTERTFKLERQDAEHGRIFSGQAIVGWLTWTDSFWVLSRSASMGDVVPFPDLRDIDEMGDAYLRSFEHLTPKSADLDLFLDPPTFVGTTDGERACWVYTAWKLLTKPAVGNSPTPSADFREWSDAEFKAANAIYRRVVRKYGGSPPDKTEAVKELMARVTMEQAVLAVIESSGFEPTDLAFYEVEQEAIANGYIIRRPGDQYGVTAKGYALVRGTK